MNLAWSSPLRARFRSLDARDGLLLRGPAGWAEFSPFWEYDDEVAVPWLRAALEAATEGFPAPLRDRVPVNVTIPAVGPELAARLEFAPNAEDRAEAEHPVADENGVILE